MVFARGHNRVDATAAQSEDEQWERVCVTELRSGDLVRFDGDDWRVRAATLVSDGVWLTLRSDTIADRDIWGLDAKLDRKRKP